MATPNWMPFLFRNGRKVGIHIKFRRNYLPFEYIPRFLNDSTSIRFIDLSLLPEKIRFLIKKYYSHDFVKFWENINFHLSEEEKHSFYFCLLMKMNKKK